MGRMLVVNSSLTLDGVMQAAGVPEEDPRGGFSHGGWSVNYWDDALGRWMGPYMMRPADLLLGRKSYEMLAAHWPYITADPGADHLNNARKYVASTTLDKVEWNNSTLLQGDVAEAVAALKAQDGPEIQVHGSANLVQTLLRHDLVDELRLMIFPLVLGTGLRLFADGTIPAGLEVVDSTVTPKGVLGVVYRRAGAIQYGSFALDGPNEAELARRRALARSRVTYSWRTGSAARHALLLAMTKRRSAFSSSVIDPFRSPRSRVRLCLAWWPWVSGSVHQGSAWLAS